MNLAGVDGCKAGWIAVFYNNDIYSYEIYNSFSTLVAQNPQLDRILIDIPIGLSSINFHRTVDGLIRKELKTRSSTVFNAPCRLAVYEPDDKNARKLNIQVEGKSLSIQSLSIRHKIREVDEYLCNKNHRIEVVESHPELCFKYLNKSKIVLSKKSKSEGITERLQILKKHEPKLLDVYEEMLLKIRRKDAKRDDLVDAMCLCLVNKLGFKNGLSYLIDDNLVDEKKIKLRIAYSIP